MRITKYKTRDVGNYYSQCQKYYTYLYSDKESLGLHYGFWYDNTKSKKEALLNQYREIFRLLDIKPNEKILDSGCGVGGASIWLAQRLSTIFVGITLSLKQVELARKYAKEREVENRTKFYKMDYFATDFKDFTFDKVFAIESFSHSYPKPKDFLREAYRILKKGGKILISDHALTRKPASIKEKGLLDMLCMGFKLFGVSNKEEILGAFKKVGFKNIKDINRTNLIQKSINPIYIKGVYGMPILRFLRFFGLVSRVELENSYAVLAQKGMYDRNLMEYFTIVAEK